MNQPAAAAGPDRFAAEQAALGSRIDQMVEVHGGSWRAAMEALLLALDYRADQIAFRYVRGRLRR